MSGGRQYPSHGRGSYRRGNGDSFRRGREDDDGEDNSKRQRRDDNGRGSDSGAGPSRGNGNNGNGSDRGRPAEREQDPGRPRRARLSPTSWKIEQNKKREERIQRELDSFDNVVTKPATLVDKTGKSGPVVRLKANFYKVNHRGGAWILNNYRVDFDPDEEFTHVKKSLVRAHDNVLLAYVFDGHNLYTPHHYPESHLVLYSRKEDGSSTTITLKHVGIVTPGDIQYLQIYAIIVRTCFRLMGLDELGRHFFEREGSTKLPNRRLEIWPGYSIALRNFDAGLMINIDLRSKVLRLDSCWDIINSIYNQGGSEADIKAELSGNIVITQYNRKTYKVNDIDFTKTPLSTFMCGDVEKSFLDYYLGKYPGVSIRNMNQPLIMSKLSRKERHRGQTGDVLLIPELCNITGLSDSQKNDFNLMREIHGVTSLAPLARCDKLDAFMNRLQERPEVKSKFEKWNMAVGSKMIDVPGRVLPQESLVMMNRNRIPEKFLVDAFNADWTNQFKGVMSMHSSVGLQKWAIVVGEEHRQLVGKLTDTMGFVARGMNFPLETSPEVFYCRDSRRGPQGYIEAINKAMSQMKECQMIFVVLSSNSPEIYGAVKRRCNIDHGVKSQCFQLKHLTNDGKPGGLRSVCTKVVIQINAKLGGEPWLGINPFKSIPTMIIGFDVHHSGKGRQAISIGAMVATTNNNYSQFYSTVSSHGDKTSLSENMCADFCKCLRAFKSKNNVLPERIIMYRDGVGQGDLNYVNGVELPQIKESMKGLYGEAMPKFIFIVVTKKGNARLFTAGQHIDNPAPGTCVDSVITLPERYDFFLVSQRARNGQTVSPITYNVLLAEDAVMDPDKIQRLTHKFCHLYYNWTGTVSVPMVCQYARKLSYLTGTTYRDCGMVSERLAHFLYFL